MLRVSKSFQTQNFIDMSILITATGSTISVLDKHVTV